MKASAEAAKLADRYVVMAKEMAALLGQLATMSGSSQRQTATCRTMSSQYRRVSPTTARRARPATTKRSTTPPG